MDKLFKKFNTLVNAEVEVSEFISNLTHITNEMLENQTTRKKKAYEMFQEFYEKWLFEGKSDCFVRIMRNLICRF